MLRKGDGSLKAKSDITIEEILSKIKSYIEEEEQLKCIEQAYQFAREKHLGQYRKTGEEYIIHPMNVVLILTTVYADYETLCAGFLHDVLEDCDCTSEEMDEAFGKNITKLVQQKMNI